MKHKYFLLGCLISSLATAASVRTTEVNPGAIDGGNNLSVAQSMVDNSMVRSGLVKYFDESSHLIVINAQQYTLNNNFKVYDGTLVKGKIVRFLLDDNKQIQEIWVMK
jgi:hypothetical protein